MNQQHTTLLIFMVLAFNSIYAQQSRLMGGISAGAAFVATSPEAKGVTPVNMNGLFANEYTAGTWMWWGFSEKNHIGLLAEATAGIVRQNFFYSYKPSFLIDGNSTNRISYTFYRTRNFINMTWKWRKYLLVGLGPVVSYSFASRRVEYEFDSLQEVKPRKDVNLSGLQNFNIGANLALTYKFKPWFWGGFDISYEALPLAYSHKHIDVIRQYTNIRARANFLLLGGDYFE